MTRLKHLGVREVGKKLRNLTRIACCLRTREHVIHQRSTWLDEDLYLYLARCMR
jgi:hypothetical protein